HFPLDAIAGAGLGMFIGGVLNLVFRVPSSSFSPARANGLRLVRAHGSSRPGGCGFPVNMRGSRSLQSGVPDQHGPCGARSVAFGRRNILEDGYSSASEAGDRLLSGAEEA